MFLPTPFAQSNSSRLPVLVVVGMVFLMLPYTALAQAEPDGLAEARSLVQEDEYDEAIPLLEALIKDHPEHADTHYWLGAAYGIKARNSGRLRQARLAPKIRKQFERAVNFDPDHLDARDGLMQYYMEAPSFMGGDLDLALEQAAAIHARDTGRGFQALISVYMAREEYDRAETVYRDAIEGADDPRGWQMSLGYFYQQTNQYDAAFDHFETLSQEETLYWRALYQVGRTAALSGQGLERGADALETYLTHTPGENEPDLANANYRLAMVYQHQQRNEDAIAALEHALELTPDHRGARELLDQLR